LTLAEIATLVGNKEESNGGRISATDKKDPAEQP
jgi:hypothetical protein